MKLTISQENIDKTIDNNERFPVGSIRDETGGQAEKSPPPDVQKLVDQILGQGTTTRWSGEGFGSAQANAREMARMLAGVGINDIKQFGKFEVYDRTDQAAGNPIDPNDLSKGFTVSEQIINENGDLVTTGRQVPVSKDATFIPHDFLDYSSTIDDYSPRTYTSGYLVQYPVYKEVFGNKETKAELPSNYSRASGNIFGGTFTGEDSTGFGVQFGSDGTPYFYTQKGESTSSAGEIMPLVNLGLTIFAPGIGGAIGSALTGTAATTLISKVVGAAIVSGTMSELSGGNFADGAIKGAVGAGVAPLVAQNIGTTVAEAMGDSALNKLVVNAVTSASTAAISTAILGNGDVLDTALKAAVASVGGTYGREIGGETGATFGTALGKIATGEDADKVITSTITGLLTKAVSAELKKDPNLGASSAEVGQGEVDAIRQQTQDAAANLNFAGTGDAATDQELVDIVAGQGNIADILSGGSGDTFAGPSGLTPKYVEAMFQMQPRDGEVAEDVTGELMDDGTTVYSRRITKTLPDGTEVAYIAIYDPELPGAPYRYEYKTGSSESGITINASRSRPDFGIDAGVSTDSSLPTDQKNDQQTVDNILKTGDQSAQDDLEAQAVINGFPDHYTMEQYNGNVEDYLRDVEASKPIVKEPDGQGVAETPVGAVQPEVAPTPEFFQPPTQAPTQAPAQNNVVVAAETPASVAPDIVEAVQESDSDRDTRLDLEAVALGFPNHSTLQVFGGDIDAYKAKLEEGRENTRNRLARYAGFPDADTLDRYGGDVSAYKKQIDDERNEEEAAVLGFPDYATMQQYGGDIAAYVEDQRLAEVNRQAKLKSDEETAEFARLVREAEEESAKAKALGFPDGATMRQYDGDIAAYNTAETKRLSDIETKRLANIETKRLEDIETKRLEDIEAKRLEDIETKRLADIETKRVADVEEARQSAARNAGFPDAATFDEYAGDVYAYQSALERKDFDQKQAEAEVLGFPDYATMQQYGGDVSKYNQDLADAKEEKRLADEEDERKRAADQKILDDAEFKRLADEAEDKRQSDARAAGFPDADTFDTYGGNIDAYNKYLSDEETKRLATIESNRQASAIAAGFPDADTLDNFGGDIDAYNKSLQVDDTKLLDDDGLLKLTPTEGENRGPITSVLAGEDSLAGTGDDTLDGLLDLTSTEVDPLKVTPVIVEDGLGEVVPVIVEPEPPEPCPEGKVRNLSTGECETPVVDDDVCPTGFHKGPTGLCISDEDKPETEECPEGKVRNLSTGECEDVVKPEITTVKPVVDPKPKANPALDALLAGLATPQSVGEDKTEPFYGKMGPYMDISADFDFLKPLGFDPKDALKRQQMNKMAVGGFIDALQAEEMTVDDLLNFLQQRN